MKLLPMLLGLFGWQSNDASVSRLVQEDEVVLRIPVQPHPIAPQFDWVEKKGPKCIPAAAIRRTSLSGSDQLDFILSGGGRVRAKFDETCPALDFYGGVYLQYGRDQQICAQRDVVMSRMGGSCTIDHFKLLLPKFKH
jgi:hypothetical protein